MSICVKTLLGKNNLEFSISCLKSFVNNATSPVKLVVLDDGTLSAVEIERLENSFDECRVVTKRDRDALIQEKLKNYPACYQYREQVIYAYKIFDAMLCDDDEDLIFIDSDVYFKKKFTLPDFNGVPTFMMGRQHAYSFTPLEFMKVKYAIFPYVNTGLFYFPRKQFDLAFIESLLNDKIINKGVGRISWLEQTLWAFIAGRGNSIQYFNPFQVVMAGSGRLLNEKTLAVHLVSTYRGEYKLLVKEQVKNKEEIVPVMIVTEKNHLNILEFGTNRLKAKLHRTWRIKQAVIRRYLRKRRSAPLPETVAVERA
jgi:Zn finger protein HypA/HybF involved in hydrogenase expression